MSETHDHTDSENVALTLRQTLPIPRRTRVYALTCGCPDTDGQLFWTIDTEMRSYELILALDGAGLRTVHLTSEQRFGDGPTWAADFLIHDTSADWVQALARLVSRQHPRRPKPSPVSRLTQTEGRPVQDKNPLTGCLPAFGRHRGYPPRYGWLRKVYDALLQDPTALRRADATVVLGVGKSMVPSMAFWSRAFGLATRDGQDLVPTDRAHWLLDDETGADPYLELNASLWLLHWWLVSSEQCHVPSWRYLFGYSPLSRSSRAEMQRRLAAAAEAAGYKTPASSVLASDIACLVSMYAPGDHTAVSVEDELSNPFRTLHLLDPEPPADRTADRSQLVALRRTVGRHCPAPVQAYASLDFAARTAGLAAGSISLARLASDPLGPGRLLLTGTADLRRALHQVADRHAGLSVVQSGDGQETLVYSRRPVLLAEDVLAGAYPALRPATSRAAEKGSSPSRS